MKNNYGVKIGWKFLTAISINTLIFITSIIVFFLPLISCGKNNQIIYYQNEILNVKIREKNITNQQKNQNGDFFLGKTGIEIFKNKINNRLGYGPEFFALKEILFTEQGNNSLIDKENSAFYLPSTQQIVLNLTPWVNYFKNNWDERFDYYDDITEWLFQSFYHEYHHHIANMYLVNFNVNDKLASDEIYIEKQNDRKIEPWNRYFINKFKTFLNYNQKSDNYSSENVTDFWGNELKKENLALKSIGSIYDAMTLFNKSNGQETPNYQKLINQLNKNIGYLFSPKITFFEPLVIIKNISLKYLTYLFSMQELFARKYMQLTFPYKKTQQIHSDGTYNYYLNNQQILSPTTYLFDTLNYQSNFFNNDDLLYLKDAPLSENNIANNLIDLFFTINGQSNSSNGKSADLSFIWYNNTSSYKINQYGLQVNNADMNKINQIKFGGFLDEEKLLSKYIGYFDDNNLFQQIPIEVYPYTYNRIAKLGSEKRQLLPNSTSNYFYVTNPQTNEGWIDINQIKNKALYFSKDKNDVNGKNIVPLKSILNENSPTWTRKFYKPLGFNNLNPTYQAIINKENYVTINVVT